MIKKADKIEIHGQYDVFLSYSHRDAEWVENLAKRLEDEHDFRVWLDKWVLVPGRSFQQSMALGIDLAKCCVVCISEHTPSGWCREEIERALNRQTSDLSFRVIPLLLPNAKTINVNNFLELRTWVDFRGPDPAYAFHTLVCGIKGVPPGRWPPRKADDNG
ncbi:MAG: toll/interleukin-1 receptor domain-containing protein [Ktedonobacteraceae bacterium]|nr:toll/interleukin-1 receptor domain-containing protein [Ktedonobacteraceae bacterium]